MAAVVAHAAYRIGSRTLKNTPLLGIAAGAFIAIFAFGVPFPLIVLSAALLGWLGGRYTPKYFQSGGGHGSKLVDHGPALIDDNTPTPAHARFSRSQLMRMLAVVGVILNLAVFFGYHVLWPQGLAGDVDIVAVLIAAAAAVSLFWARRGVIEVIAVAGVVGLALQWLPF